MLGTSSAIPTINRNHIALFLNYKDENILIDCGEGTQRQIRKAKINPCSITRLLITHFHGDHVFGLPGLFQTLALNNYNKTLYIYGPKGTNKFVNEILKTFIGINAIKTQIKETKRTFLKTKDFEITALPLNHDAPCNGYSFQEKDRLRINKEKLEKLKIPNIPQLANLTKKKNISYNKLKINYKDLTYLEKGKKVSIILDTALCNNINKLIKNSDLAILESTFLEESENGEKLAKKYKHLTAKQAAKISKKSKVKQLILTHISQRYEKNPELLLHEAKSIFPNTKLANDFDVVEV
jgi:ribonuclease Z